ncbi:hypothetical protein DMENIID0001_144130 [Sergentomyia squamirostris]
MTKCCVKKCPNAGINVVKCGSRSLSLHKFPCDKLLKKQWLEILEMDEKELTTGTRVCSEHFAPDSVFTKIKKHKPTRELRPGTIPINLRSTVEGETPVADRPVVEPPFDDRPVVEPPFDDGPVVEPPFDDRPVVEPPFDDRPVVEPPFDDRPVVEPPFDDRLVVEPPFDDRPVVDPSVNDHPVDVDIDPVVSMQSRSLSNQICKRLREESTEKESLNFFNPDKSFLYPMPKRFRKEEDVDMSTITIEYDTFPQQNLDLTNKVTELGQEVEKKNAIIDKLNRRIAILLNEQKNISRKLRRRNSVLENIRSTGKSTQKSECTIETCSLLGKLPEVLHSIALKLLDKTSKFSPELKKFAKKIDYLSPKTYRFLRSILQNALPHPRTLQRWYEDVPCEPGFLPSVFSTLKNVADKNAESGSETLCFLVFDEMHIFEHVQPIGDTLYGVSHFLNKEGEPIKATQVIVFLLVSIDLKWKIPIGYFPITSLDAEKKKDLIHTASRECKDVGVTIVGTTFDGCSTNYKTMNDMGADLYTRGKDTYTIKIVDNTTEANVANDGNDEEVDEIFVYPDPCHMLKSVRNTFKKWNMEDCEGRKIKFSYVKDLYELQNRKGIQLTNKLTRDHIEYENKIMNVELASQLMSNSVADDLDHCRDVLKLPKFKGSEGTSQFIRVINDIFDTLNSHKISDVGRKSLLRENNICDTSEFCKKAVAYLSGLQIIRKVPKKNVKKEKKNESKCNKKSEVKIEKKNESKGNKKREVKIEKKNESKGNKKREVKIEKKNESKGNKKREVKVEKKNNGKGKKRNEGRRKKNVEDKGVKNDEKKRKEKKAMTWKKSFVTTSPNKSGFLGFIICLTNLPHIYSRVKHNVPDGFATYALSQDHIETMFGHIRQKQGANTNPTVIMFRASLKRIITNVQMDEVAPGSNCKSIVSVQTLPIRCTILEKGESINGAPADVVRVTRQGQVMKPRIQDFAISCKVKSLWPKVEPKLKKFCENCSACPISVVLEILKATENWFKKTISHAKDISNLKKLLDKDEMMKTISPVLAKVQTEMSRCIGGLQSTKFNEEGIAPAHPREPLLVILM